MTNGFGWHYPPGCSGPPDPYDMPCEICQEDVDHCCCPECPECEAVGDPDCYKNHGMKLSLKQHQTMQRVHAELEAEYKWERRVANMEFEWMQQSSYESESYGMCVRTSSCCHRM